MHVERRRHRRFRVKYNAFAVINIDPVQLVPIIDIGMGGIGVYVNDGKPRLNGSSKLEIMVADCSFYLENLPFKIMSNLRAIPANSSNLLDGWRYSLKFGNLMPNQKSRLKYFIRNYTEADLLWQVLHKFSKLLNPTWANKYAADSCTTSIWHGLHRPTL